MKGIVSLRNASDLRNEAPLNVTVGQKVHSQCRAIYIHPRKIEDHLKKAQEPSASPGKRLRSKDTFDFRSNCLFCVRIDFDGDERVGNTSAVSTLDTEHKLLQACTERNDEWGHLVRGRIESVNDLPAADAIYHRTCFTNFVTKKNIPISQAGPARKKAKLGRKMDPTTDKVFQELTSILENNDDAQISLTDLVSLMEEKLKNSSSIAYSSIYMRRRLEEHFGDNIVFTNLPGKRIIITFRKKRHQSYMIFTKLKGVRIQRLRK